MFARRRTSLVLAVLLSTVLGSARLGLALDDWSTPGWYMTPAQAQEWWRAPSTFRDREALKASKLTPAQLKALQKVVDYYLSRMAHNDVVNLPREVVERFVSEIDSSLTSNDARYAMMDQIIGRAPDLLKHPVPLVRTNMMWLLAQLSIKKAEIDRTTGFEIPAVPYNSVYKVLIQVLRDPSQLLECRIIAAWGLARICRDGAPGSPSSIEKSDIAMALVDTLNEVPLDTREENLWFRNRLIEALGYVDRINNVQEQPIVIDTLLGVIVNAKETFDNRAQAARSISQLPLPGNTNVPLVTYAIVRLLRDMSLTYNKQPQYGGWRRAFTNVYLSFRPAKAKEAKERRWGLLYVIERPGLQTHAAIVQSGWGVVHPVTVQVMDRRPPPLANAVVQSLTTWLDSNKPASWQAVPNGKAFPEQ